MSLYDIIADRLAISPHALEVSPRRRIFGGSNTIAWPGAGAATTNFAAIPLQDVLRQGDAILWEHLAFIVSNDTGTAIADIADVFLVLADATNSFNLEFLSQPTFTTPQALHVLTATGFPSPDLITWEDLEAGARNAGLGHVLAAADQPLAINFIVDVIVPGAVAQSGHIGFEGYYRYIRGVTDG